MKIFISGGTGFIGDYFRMMLIREGHLLTVLTRFPDEYEDESAENQRFVSWDDDMVSRMEETDVVINMAGASIFGRRWTEEVKKKIYSSRIESTRTLVEAVKRADSPPETFISTSGANYYKGKEDQVLDESAERADNFLANVCIDWEKEAHRAEEAGVRVVIPRLGIVLEKEGGALGQMLTPFKMFVGGPIGSGEQYFPWIHMHDVCRGLLFAIRENDFEGPFNLNAPNPVKMREFARELGSQLNRPSLFRVPTSVLQLVLGEAALPITESLRMQPKKLQQHGFEFQYEYLTEALGDIL
jgi:uncharacterized protein (TIGR01777 family)